MKRPDVKAEVATALALAKEEEEVQGGITQAGTTPEEVVAAAEL
jgi:hypothetical protein